jgi:hypothetical protein
LRKTDDTYITESTQHPAIAANPNDLSSIVDQKNACGTATALYFTYTGWAGVHMGSDYCENVIVEDQPLRV